MSEILKRLSYRKLCEYNLIAQAVVHTKDKKERRRSKNNMRFAHTQIAQNLHFTKWLNFFFFCPDSWENTATKQNKTIRRLPKGLFYVIFVYNYQHAQRAPLQLFKIFNWNWYWFSVHPIIIAIQFNCRHFSLLVLAVIIICCYFYFV